MSFIPSQYQESIFDFVKNGTGNAVIEAVAGSGKTTTLIKCLEQIDSSLKVLFLAFNKSIAMELQERAPKHCQACTLNSFGWQLCLKNSGKKFIKLDAGKTGTLLRFNILKVNEQNREEKAYYYTIRNAVTRLVSLLKANYILKPTPKDINELVDKYGIDLIKVPDINRFNDIVIATYTLSISTLNVMDFDDQIFMPIYHNWKMPSYDFVFVDESQDLNPVQIEFIMKLAA